MNHLEGLPDADEEVSWDGIILEFGGMETLSWSLLFSSSKFSLF